MLEADLQALLKRPEIPLVERKPSGWTPSVQVTSSDAQIKTQVRQASNVDPDEKELLEEAGLDPNVWSIDKLRKSRWQSANGEWLEAFRISASKRSSDEIDPEELTLLRKEIKLLPPIKIKYVNPPSSKATFVVALADWQIGKGEAGGSEATISRIQNATEDAAARLEELIKIGRAPECIALIGLGDLIENCSGWYSMQEYQIDLTRREQTNIVRRLLIRIIRRFASFGIKIVVGTVAGNHGENRKNGKSYTTFGDNDDVAVFEQVADIVSEVPEAFGFPQFAIPGDDLSLLLDLSGVRVGIVHGHQFGSGATSGQKAISWWSKQALGNQGIGVAQILLSGHFHHLSVLTFGERTHIQCPTIDGGSQWFKETAGQQSVPGMLTMLVGQTCGPYGWSDLYVIP